jgi:VanZ family protein
VIEKMKLKYLLPAIVWTLLMLWLITIPGSSIPETPFLNIPHFDKLVHAIIFAVFTFLVNYGFFMQKKLVYSRHHYTISLVLGVIYSVFTEWIQLEFVVGRSGELMDIVADLTGCLLGAIAFYYRKYYLPISLLK